MLAFYESSKKPEMKILCWLSVNKYSVLCLKGKKFEILQYFDLFFKVQAQKCLCWFDAKTQ
jgi:hypothetical protein